VLEFDLRCPEDVKKKPTGTTTSGGSPSASGGK
jgi:hypothetical protein